MSNRSDVRQLALGLDQPPVAGASDASHTGVGEPTWIGNWQVRSFHGFHQSREAGIGQWKFYVSTFCDARSGRSHCYVMLFGGGVERVPIDEQDRILVLGRRYGRSRWSH